MTPDQRQAIAAILEIVAKDGLPGPRDLDVALDAIECELDLYQEHQYQELKGQKAKHIEIAKTTYRQMSEMPLAASKDYWQGVEDACETIADLIETEETIFERLENGKSNRSDS